MDNVKIKLDIQANEVYAKTIVNQEFFNYNEKPIEMEAHIQKNSNNFIFSSFIIQIGESIKIKSKVIKKSKAEEKYTDAIAQGNAAVFTELDKEGNIIVHMGNIPPKEKLIFISEFIQPMVPLKDYKYYLTLNYGSDLPILRRKYEEAFNNNIINCSLKLKTKIKIEEINISDFPEQLVIKEKKLNEEKNEYILLLFDIENSKKTGFDEFLVDEGITGLFSGTLIFKLEPNSDIFLFSQIAPKYEEQQSLKLFFKIQEENKNNLIPGLFIILLEQKFFSQFRDEIYEIIHIFLYSIPPGSYIQLISDYKTYDENQKEYNQNYIEECLKNIQTMESNKTETNLCNSLKNIYESRNTYDKISLAKYICLVTDGDIKG